jgi:6-phosphogluconolactonase
MRYNIFVIFLLTLTSLTAGELLYVSSGGAIEVKEIDSKTGKLTDFQKVDLPGLSKFTFSRNKKFLYAQAILNGKRQKVSIATYKVAADGKLSFVHNALISGRTTELKTDRSDRFLAAANYSAGTVSIWKLEDGVYRGELVEEMKIEKKVHAVRFSPDNKVLCIPATGPNKVFELSFNEKTGKITRRSEALGPKDGASQPRHLVFHQTLSIAYTTLERVKPGVAAWTWDSKKGELKLLQVLSNSDDTTGRITNADLHLTPDSKFLYISCRDKQRELDQIIAYKVNPEDGTLSLVKGFSCEAVPRSFCLNKTGDFIYVCGMGVDKMGVYKIDKMTGQLSKITQYKTGKNAIWVETLIR